MSKTIFTYQTRLSATPGQDAALAAYAELYGRVERSLFAAIQAGGDYSRLKSEYLRRFEITARQYNAVAAGLKGKIASIKKRRPGLISELEAKIASSRKTITRLKTRVLKSAKPVDKLKNKLHQKKRRLRILEDCLSALKSDHANDETRICFGSRKLFRAQSDLEANGHASLDEWRIDWKQSRSREFFVIGSKDETAGCQGCVATIQPNGSINLRLRLPNAIGKHAHFTGVRFAYGQPAIESSLLAGTAISYRFVRDDKGWRVLASTEYRAPAIITNRNAGAIGIDINADCLAASEIDRFGNLAQSRVIDCVTYGKSTDQAKATIGDAVKLIVERAKTTRKPIIIEELDFAKRKAEIIPGHEQYARKLSSFAYSRIQQTLCSACIRAGVEVVPVNPEFTSTIGAVNFARRHGISTHQGAAFAIARRGLGFSEHPSVPAAIAPACNGDHVTFPLPVRNREKHVWSFWSVVRKKLEAAHVAHIRSGGRVAIPAPLRQNPALGATWMLPAGSRRANRQQHCSVGVVEDVPF